ncbi:polyadenylate-binding protein 4-like protein [Leptotrombidium deliense]|uniref:Polyadenylate-binding protein 4-like protein n=1 Tax=Leptotrombidium deliense TaxID=299467 RepID=A0A443SAR9_9ACAR|nr:polyadenylate-binding protein 4-like protein [Leptotrombidium deliense]
MGVEIYDRDKRHCKKSKGKSGVSSGFSSRSESRSSSRLNSDSDQSSDNEFTDSYSSVSDTSSQIRKMSLTNNFSNSKIIGNNLYVRGFKNEIKNDQQLENLFKKFGSIISAKCIVEKNKVGEIIKHFGYVCFENEQSAKVALHTMNGFTFPSGVTIHVMPYEEKEMRINKNIRSRPTTPVFGMSEVNRSCDFQRTPFMGNDSSGNHASGSQSPDAKVGIPDENKVYVSNFGNVVTSKEDLQSLFAQFGNILTTRLTLHKSVNKSFGIISYENVFSANKAISQMNGCEIERGRNLIVNHYTKAGQRKNVDKKLQSPADEQKDLENLKIESMKKVVNPSTRIFIKNINEFYTIQQLLITFGNFGRIKFASILKDERGNLRGLAFIDFYKQSSALNAIDGMNGSDVPNGKVMKVERFMESFEIREYLKINFLSQFKVNRDIRQPNQCFLCASNADSNLIVLDCKHKFCKSCLRKYVSYLMDQFEVEIILCPSVVCQYEMDVSTLKQLEPLLPVYLRLGITLHTRQQFVNENRIMLNAEKWCPRDWCRSNLSQSSIFDSHAKCRKCGYEFCFRCGDDFHNNSQCDA